MRNVPKIFITANLVNTKFYNVINKIENKYTHMNKKLIFHPQFNWRWLLPSNWSLPHKLDITNYCYERDSNGFLEIMHMKNLVAELSKYVKHRWNIECEYDSSHLSFSSLNTIDDGEILNLVIHFSNINDAIYVKLILDNLMNDLKDY